MDPRDVPRYSWEVSSEGPISNLPADFPASQAEFDFTLTGSGGKSLFVRRFLPPGPYPRRTLVYVHGGCIHGAWYADFARTVAARGWRVYLPDLRGHGRSEGPRVHVASFSEYLDDLSVLWRHGQFEGASTAIVGHSAGGLIAASFAATCPDTVAAVVLLAPLMRLKLRVSALTRALGRALVGIWPQVRIPSGIRARDLAVGDDVQQGHRADPLISRTVTAGWFFAMEAAIENAWESAGRVRQPLLVLQGVPDRIVDPDATRAWTEAAGSTDKQFVLLQDHLHELLLEPDWRVQTAAILDWLEARVPAQRPGDPSR